MRLACICFTAGGERLARRVQAALPGWQVSVCAGYGGGKTDVHAWTENAFAEADALLFVGAAGIAVRAVAPLLAGKTCDPAVLVMDEEARHVVPILSGHIGGGNRLAKQLAACLGGQAVLTTATDVKGVWAVDEWAARRGYAIHNSGRIKEVSARLLRGEEVALYADADARGPLPPGVCRTQEKARAHVVVSPFREQGGAALQLVPRCVAVGMGCRKGTAAEALAAAFEKAAEKAGVLPAAVCGVYSIDLKQNEAGLQAFCQSRGWPFAVYSAEALQAVHGSASPSAFVQAVAGVDNVCERSALAGGGFLLLPKMAEQGVTVALALRPITLVFEDDV